MYGAKHQCINKVYDIKPGVRFIEPAIFSLVLIAEYVIYQVLTSLKKIVMIVNDE